MRKVLLSAIAACTLASVTQAADGVVPADDVREAAPIGLVGEPWPPGSEQQAQQSVASVPLPRPRPSAANSIDSADMPAVSKEPTTFGVGDLPANPDAPRRN